MYNYLVNFNIFVYKNVFKVKMNTNVYLSLNTIILENYKIILNGTDNIQYTKVLFYII